MYCKIGLTVKIKCNWMCMYIILMILDICVSFYLYIILMIMDMCVSFYMCIIFMILDICVPFYMCIILMIGHVFHSTCASYSWYWTCVFHSTCVSLIEIQWLSWLIYICWVSEWLLLSKFSAIKWREQATFNEMIIMSALY